MCHGFVASVHSNTMYLLSIYVPTHTLLSIVSVFTAPEQYKMQNCKLFLTRQISHFIKVMCVCNFRLKYMVIDLFLFLGHYTMF
jgi:hypothetical protein